MASEKQTNRKITIVGAGPAGLTAALALHKLGFMVKVFEQTQDFKQIGGGIMIHNNGQQVLAALGLLKDFEPQMVLVEKGLMQGLHGKILMEVDFTEIDVPFNRVAVIWRYQLQEFLLAAAEKAGIEVAFNHRLENLELSENQAVLQFENGAKTVADIVIAADGMNSRTRDAAGIEFQKIAVGEGWVRGASKVEFSNKAFREIWGNDGRRFGVAPLTDEKTYFYARVPLGKWKEIRENSLDEWIESWRDFGDDVVPLLQNVEDWQKVNYSELFEIRADEWAKPPIFLIGDAIHAMTPNVGQGANSAMVDALVLARMLAKAEKNGKTLSEVGSEFTSLRRPFVTKIQNTARQSGDLAAKTSALAHFTRDAIFKLSKNFSAFRRKNLLITAGYNPCEKQFFTPIDNA